METWELCVAVAIEVEASVEILGVWAGDGFEVDWWEWEHAGLADAGGDVDGFYEEEVGIIRAGGQSAEAEVQLLCNDELCGG